MVPDDGSAPATVYPQRRATPANDPRLTSPRLTRPKSFDPLKCRALFRPKPPRTWRRADYHRTRTGLRSNGPSTSSRRRAIRSEVVLGDGVQSREDVPGHRLAFECGDGLLNALLADGGVLGDQAWYSPFFRPSTSFGLASTPTRSTCDLAGVAPGRPACRACPRIPLRCGSRPRNRFAAGSSSGATTRSWYTISMPRCRAVVRSVQVGRGAVQQDGPEVAAPLRTGT